MRPLVIISGRLHADFGPATVATVSTVTQQLTVLEDVLTSNTHPLSRTLLTFHTYSLSAAVPLPPLFSQNPLFKGLNYIGTAFFHF